MLYRVHSGGQMLCYTPSSLHNFVITVQYTFGPFDLLFVGFLVKWAFWSQAQETGDQTGVWWCKWQLQFSRNNE